MFCPNCGRELDEGARFCRHCGAVVTHSESEIPTEQSSVLDDEPTCWPQLDEETASSMPSDVPTEPFESAGKTEVQPAVGQDTQTDEQSKQPHKRTRLIIAVVCIAVIAGVAFYFLSGMSNQSQAVVLKDDVFVYDEGDAGDMRLVSCDDSGIVLSDATGIKEGTVFVTGPTEAAPDGLMRRVTAVEKDGDNYRLETEPASITDAVEKCNIQATAYLNDDGSFTVVQDGEEQEQAAADTDEGSASQQATSDVAFSADAEHYAADGKMTVTVNLVVEDGDVEMSVEGNPVINAKFKGANGTFDENVLDQDLDPIVIQVGDMPLVISSHLTVGMSGDVALTDTGIDESETMNTVIGFKYTSDGGIEPIKDDASTKPAETLQPASELFSGSFITAEKVTWNVRLYGVGGADLSSTLDNNLTFELQVVPDGEDTDGAIRIDGSDLDYRGTLSQHSNVSYGGTFVLDQSAANPFDGDADAISEDQLTLFGDDDTLELVSNDQSFGKVETAWQRLYAAMSHDYSCYSGAGGWQDNLTFNEDGTFSGTLHDVNGAEIWVSNYSGRLENVQRIDDYTYTATITSLSYQQTPGTSETKDGVYYNYSTCAFSDGMTITFYLAGRGTSDIDLDVMTWYFTVYSSGTDQSTLPLDMMVANGTPYCGQ